MNKNYKNSYIPFSFTKIPGKLSNRDEVAEMIIEARIKKGISQEALAKKIGIKQPNIARWENGTISPSNESLEKIAEALGTELILPKFKFLENGNQTANKTFEEKFVMAQTINGDIQFLKNSSKAFTLNN